MIGAHRTQHLHSCLGRPIDLRIVSFDELIVFIVPIEDKNTAIFVVLMLETLHSSTGLVSGHRLILNVSGRVMSATTTINITILDKHGHLV